MTIKIKKRYNVVGAPMNPCYKSNHHGGFSDTQGFYDNFPTRTSVISLKIKSVKTR